MDTFKAACQAVRALDLQAQIDPFRARIHLPFTELEHNTSYSIWVQATATGICFRAGRLAETGGEGGVFVPGIAAFAAMLAYDLDLHLAADVRDGEIEARGVVELVGIPPSLCSKVIAAALSAFLDKQARARAALYVACQQGAVDSPWGVPSPFSARSGLLPN